MSRLWVKVIKKNRIDRQQELPCAWGEEHSALQDITKAMDLPNPIWLSKHVAEYEAYRRTAFLPDHFIEAVDFQRLEIDFLEDSDVKRRSRDPRNDFGSF